MGRSIKEAVDEPVACRQASEDPQKLPAIRAHPVIVPLDVFRSLPARLDSLSRRGVRDPELLPFPKQAACPVGPLFEAFWTREQAQGTASGTSPFREASVGGADPQV